MASGRVTRSHSGGGDASGGSANVSNTRRLHLRRSGELARVRLRFCQEDEEEDDFEDEDEEEEEEVVQPRKKRPRLHGRMRKRSESAVSAR